MVPPRDLAEFSSIVHVVAVADSTLVELVVPLTRFIYFFDDNEDLGVPLVRDSSEQIFDSGFFCDR